MNRFPPRLRLIKGGKKSPKPPKPPSRFLTEFGNRFRDFYWEPYIFTLLMILLLIFSVAVLSQLK